MSPAGRAVLHIGTPKSGTTYLQRALWEQREPLRARGVHVAGDRAQDMFLAAIEVRGTYEFWGRDPDEVAGTWARMCAAARAAGGTTVMSHELLCAARKPQIDQALAELEGLEVHVVVSVRDVARQLISSWQEEVKNGRTTSFEDYQSATLAKLERGDFTGAFWRFQDLPGMLGRWGRQLMPERVHVVVAPPSGAPPGQLWDRFARAVGFDPEVVPAPRLARSNETLGLEQVAVLRRVNEALGGRIRHPEYGRVVKRQFAQRTLASLPGTRPQCPPDVVERLLAFAEQVNTVLTTRGYQVHGDLGELLPRPTAPGAPHPDEVSPDAEAQVLATLVAEQLVRQSRRRGPRPVLPGTWRSRLGGAVPPSLRPALRRLVRP